MLSPESFDTIHDRAVILTASVNMYRSKLGQILGCVMNKPAFGGPHGYTAEKVCLVPNGFFGPHVLQAIKSVLFPDD